MVNGLRILFCGSGVFAVPSLEAICAGPHDLVGVITQPARPAGRGGKLRHTPVEDFCARHGLETMQCAKINAPDSIDRIAALKPDVIFVADFGQMIRQAVRDCARLDTINLHGSLLPELRGAAPINWAIIRGYRQTGVTTFSLVDEMDAGAMYLTGQTDVDSTETTEQLRERLALLGADVTCRTLEMIRAGDAQPCEQDHAKATLAPRLKKSDGLIDWTADAETIRNVIHGTWPWPGGQAVFHGAKHKDVQVVIARAAAEPSSVQGEPGRLDDDLCIATGRDRLRILEIKPAGKRLMNWRDFANGYRLAAGDMMVRNETPAK